MAGPRQALFDLGNALERLVANLLDMTRIQSGALELRPEIVPVADLVEGALLATALPPSRGQVSVLGLDPEVPAERTGIRRQLGYQRLIIDVAYHLKR